uniref:Uncharacterized protein n=2 Tax=Aegilops tauschii subsp. strangulata TaxID=200361 RepID=A0A453PNC1_AEGTS
PGSSLCSSSSCRSTASLPHRPARRLLSPYPPPDPRGDKMHPGAHAVHRGCRCSKECFYIVFEDEIHRTIVDNNLFKVGERVAIGASGGKDSTVLAYVLSRLNKRHNYGLDLFLLSIDEGITGYKDDSLETVKRNEIQYGLPLKIVSYKELYDWTMDDIVKAIGLKTIVLSVVFFDVR